MYTENINAWQSTHHQRKAAKATKLYFETVEKESRKTTSEALNIHQTDIVMVQGSEFALSPFIKYFTYFRKVVSAALSSTHYTEKERKIEKQCSRQPVIYKNTCFQYYK